MFTIDIAVAGALFSLWFLMGMGGVDDEPYDLDEHYDE